MTDKDYEITQKLIDDLEKSYLAELQQMRIENEKLKAERDAAVADLDELRCCHSCKHNQMRDGFGRKCVKYDAWRIWNHSCAEWEWRGVQNE